MSETMFDIMNRAADLLVPRRPKVVPLEGVEEAVFVIHLPDGSFYKQEWKGMTRTFPIWRDRAEAEIVARNLIDGLPE